MLLNTEKKVLSSVEWDKTYEFQNPIKTESSRFPSHILVEFQICISLNPLIFFLNYMSIRC